MDDGLFRPWAPLPDDLVWPVRIDPDGRSGPTRGEAQRGRWRAAARGWFVPTDTDSIRVEQRILEQGVRVVGTGGAITAWAALRWRGAQYFDGRGWADHPVLPVPIYRRAGHHPRRQGRAFFSASHMAPPEIEQVHGLPCATVERALFDEMRGQVSPTRPHLRTAVVAADMTMAAGLTSRSRLAAYVETRCAWDGVPLVRDALALGSEDSRSPQETRMRLVWVLDAELPPPLCNQPLFDLAGNLVGYPDLLDPVAGMVGEYDGAEHKRADRHRRDVAREARFRDVGLEYFTVVGGDLADRELVVSRMLSTRRRARFLAPDRRAWTLTPPPWWADQTA